MTHISQADSNWRDWLFAKLFFFFFAHIIPTQTDNRILDKRILIDIYFYEKERSGCINGLAQNCRQL